MALSQHSSLLILLAGVAFFMYGMTLASESLQKLMANRIRDLLGKVSHNNFITVGIGVLLTIALQSSGAVTSMLVGLGSAGVVALSQVMGIIIGTAIGTTLTVQLISFNVAQYGLPIFTVAFSFYFLTRHRVLKNMLSVAMGFGLIFFGIELISTGTDFFQKMDFFHRLFIKLSSQPVWSLLLSMAFTGFVHSSAVTIGFAMSLATNGVISFHDSLYWVFGANIGTTATALMASLGGNYVGRQVAWAHFFYKFVTAILFMIFIEGFSFLIELMNGSINRQIANAHTLYNIGAAILFFPFIKYGSAWIEKLFPPRSNEQEFRVKYLEDATYSSMTLAVAHARRELMRMGDIVNSMIEDSLQLFSHEDPELMDSIEERDNQVDHLHHEIKLFLVKCVNDSNERMSREVFDLISLASDLESAADVVDNTMLELARKKHALKIDFSEIGWDEITEFHKDILQASRTSMSAFQIQDKELCTEAIELKRSLRKRERKLRQSHIDRLNQGLQESINTSSIHLDLLSDYRRVAGLMIHHCYALRKTL